MICSVFYHFSAFVGQYTERTKTHGLPNVIYNFQVAVPLLCRLPDKMASVEGISFLNSSFP